MADRRFKLIGDNSLADNVKSSWGTDDDVTAWFDGTDFKIDGTNTANISISGVTGALQLLDHSLKVLDPDGGGMMMMRDTGGTGTAAVAWLEFQDSASSRMGFLGYGSGSDGILYINNDVHGENIRLQAETAGGTNVVLAEFDPDLDAVTVTSDANFIVEGHATGRNILRSTRLQIQPGSTPGTNISVTDTSASSGRGYNTATVTNGTNIAKSGTSGSFSLNASGNALTFTPTENCKAIIGCTIHLHDIFSSSTTRVYFPWVTIVTNAVQFQLLRRAEQGGTDFTVLLAAGDRIDVNIQYITDS